MVPVTIPQQEACNPFSSAFDSNETEDDWWDEEDIEKQRRLGSPSDVRITQWPRPLEHTGLGPTIKPTMNRRNTRNQDRRYSVKKGSREKSKGRQKNQNAKADIKLVTNFSRYEAATSPFQMEPRHAQPKVRRMVDVETLKALGCESARSSANFWRPRNDQESASDGNEPSNQYSNFLATHKAIAVDSSPKYSRPRGKSAEELSPDDRPIIIGITIPSGNVTDHAFTPPTASSEISKIRRSPKQYTPTNYTPETPTIMITPAQESSSWSVGYGYNSDSRPHPASSIYSDAHYTASDAPPVPEMPPSLKKTERDRIVAQNSCFFSDPDISTWNEDPANTSTNPRASTYTVFEEDGRAVLGKTVRAMYVSGGSKGGSHMSVSSVATQRRSNGWWNYIKTPFLSRTNTFTDKDEVIQPPSVPGPAALAAKSWNIGRGAELCEKDSSPLTPQASVTTDRDHWWKIYSMSDPQDKSPTIQETRHRVQRSSGGLLMVNPETAGFESASEAGLIAEVESKPSHTLRLTRKSIRLFRKEITDSKNLKNHPPSADPLSADTESVQQSENEDFFSIVKANGNGPHISTRSYSPSAREYQAVLPPGHPPRSNPTSQPTSQSLISPGPLSPGLHEVTTSLGGGISLSDVPLTPVPWSTNNPNFRYREFPVTPNGRTLTTEYLQAASRMEQKKQTIAKETEKKRRRNEKEDIITLRARGCWRGRGCISDRGCYSRGVTKGRKRQRCYLVLVGLLIMVVLVVALLTTLHRKPRNEVSSSQWLNLTGFPPIFLGFSAITSPINTEINTGCAFPATQWSCDLPKELQPSIAPNPSNQPNFFLEIQWDNRTLANNTFANFSRNAMLNTRAKSGHAVSAGQFIRHIFLNTRQSTAFIPSPAPPSLAEETFLGRTTDGVVSENKAGESTPFYISFIQDPTSTVTKRQALISEADPFPNVSSILPPPSINSDGTAAPANLLPFPTQQPIRLYDRGLPTEHYGFYTYFDRSIFLKSLDLLNKTNSASGEVPDDLNGGAQKSEASYRCTWAQTRFLVQMWTRMNTTAKLNNATTQSEPSQSVMKRIPPQKFPYPTTITIDRHGGDAALKTLYCYKMDNRERLIRNAAQINTENRGFGGILINPAPTIFHNVSDETLGGFDGGSAGCRCLWTNFQETLRKEEMAA